MSDIIITSEVMTDIANAIRSKTGSTDKLYPKDMADEITFIKYADSISIIPYLERTATEITIPKDVVNLTDNIFRQWQTLKTVRFESGSKLKSICGAVFEGCSELESISIPGGVESIGDSAFDSCIKLSRITFPSILKTIGESVFWGCSTLLIPDFPEGLEYIGGNAFRECTSFTGKITFPSTLKTIGPGAFQGCTGLSTVNFQNSPTTIGPTVFQGCTNLKTINVPWASGAVPGAPWGATSATIVYNYKG